MRRIFLSAISMLVGIMVNAQTFPVVVNNTNQGTNSLPITIHPSSNGGSTIAEFNPDSKLVAISQTTGTAKTGRDGSTTTIWYQVDLPGTTSAVVGYVPMGSTLSNPECGYTYITVNTKTELRPSAGITGSASSSFVRVNGGNGYVFPNQKFAVKRSTPLGNITWYEIYLTNSPYCSQQTGWISDSQGAVSRNTSSGDGLPAPVLSQPSVSGNSATFTWTMAVQPSGNVKTSFEVWRTTNQNPAALITTIQTKNYTDPGLNLNNSYTYYIVARYNSCSSQRSNSQPVGNTSGGNTGGTGTVTVVLSPNNIGAKWALDGVGTNSSGAVVNTTYGLHTITFTSVSGYNPPNSQSVTLNSNNTNPILTANYTQAVTCSSYPPPPGNVQASAPSSSQINLSWSAVNGASGYRIYDCNGGYMGNSNNTSYPVTSLQPATLYSYKVKSVNSQQCESQTFSNCASATTKTNTPTSYTISGKVATSAGVGIANVNVTTPPPQPQYQDVTDANGNYSITNVPISYSGSVSASLKNYSFTPSSLSVNSSNIQGKKFDFTGTFIPPPSIHITTSDVPPWQRENDELTGSITASYANIPIGGVIQLDIYSNGIYAGTATKVTVTSSSGATNFNFTTLATSLSPKPINGGQVGYQLIYNPTGAHDEVPQHTAIIEKKWDNKNVIYISGSKFLIPLKYFSNTISTTISFSRVSGTSSYTDNLVNVPTVQFDNQKYFILDYSNSLLQTVKPGAFNYTINYNPSGFYKESGTFDLTKIGSLGSSANNDTTVVIIGGNRNSIEDNFQYLYSHQNPNGNSNKDFSIAENLRYGEIGKINANYNTWYIAQGNINYIEKNAYDIGKALDLIISLTSPKSVHLIAHSFGGVEVRAMLGGIGKSMDNTDTYSNVDTYAKINTVTFLSTPHRGISFGSIRLIDGSAADEMKSESLFIKSLLPSKGLPNNIRFLNITGVDDSYAFPTDGVVDAWSSENPYLKNNFGQQISVGQLYVKKLIAVDFYAPFANSILSIAHSMTHHTDIISKLAYSVAHNYATLNRIFSFIRGEYQAEVQIHGIDVFSNNIGSILSGSKFLIKYLGETEFHQKNIYDENGVASITFFPILQIGDSIKVVANGYETQILPINSTIINSRKISICMFKSQIPSTKVQYPLLSLADQNPISSQRNIQLKVTANNVVDFYINRHSSDTLFNKVTPLNNIVTLSLDTGYNKIIIKYISRDKITLLEDTALQEKIVYYFPGSMMEQNTYDLKVKANAAVFGSKMYIDNQFVRNINSFDTIIPVLAQRNEVKFNKFGFISTLSIIDSSSTLNIALLLQPYSYSSLTDSSIYDFNTKLNPQYWKNISLKNISSGSDIQISAKQYDDTYKDKGLKPQTRKFIFRNLTGNPDVKLRTAIALDQAETPNVDSVYLLSIKNGKYTKYEANKVNLSEYDPEVQKLAFDSIALKSNETQEIVLMKKQAPIALNPTSLETEECKTQDYPLNLFVADPDSIKNDLVVSCANPNVIVRGNFVHVNTQFGSGGKLNFALSFTHDFITINKTFYITVLPCPIKPSNTFTPNGDGINDTWTISNLGNFPNCVVNIFTRSGNLIYHSVGYGKAWDGTFGRKALPTGTYYYIIEPKEKGYVAISGGVTIIR